MKKTIQIFIVDDHQLVREGLVSIINDFQEDFKLVGTAGNGVEALNVIKEMSHKPKVVLMDVNMPHMNGMECTRKLQELFPEIKVIALTMHNQGLHIKQMLKEGVCGYVLKDCDKRELREAILEVAKGGTYFSRGVTHEVMMQFSQLRKEMKKGSAIALSPREKEVLKLILEDKSNKDIAEELHISVRTVETHKQNLISKTGANSVAGLVVFALKNNIGEDFLN